MPTPRPGPLLTWQVHQKLLAARHAGLLRAECSLDLDRSTTTVELGTAGWVWETRAFPFMESCKDRTVYYWVDGGFQPVARFSSHLIKLVPTDWGPPTFEIDGIKMLPTARESPLVDAGRKVGLIQPRGKSILDTCGGLGYFAAQCLASQARHVQSYEKSPDVMWLRSLNPWSPESPWGPGAPAALTLTRGDITEQLPGLPDDCFDAILHDPPRFGIAGELYSQLFYNQLARVLRRKGKLFHYTGAPNKLSRGRDLASEVATRLRLAGFAAELHGDGVLAVKS
jgi:predicted methyltransferase